MTITLGAIFDGRVLRPEEPLELKPNTRVLITIETLPVVETNPVSFLDTALSLGLQGPADWSTKLDDYLYGVQDDGSSLS